MVIESPFGKIIVSNSNPLVQKVKDIGEVLKEANLKTKLAEIEDFFVAGIKSGDEKYFEKANKLIMNLLNEKSNFPNINDEYYSKMIVRLNNKEISLISVLDLFVPGFEEGLRNKVIRERALKSFIEGGKNCNDDNDPEKCYKKTYEILIPILMKKNFFSDAGDIYDSVISRLKIRDFMVNFLKNRNNFPGISDEEYKNFILNVNKDTENPLTPIGAIEILIPGYLDEEAEMENKSKLNINPTNRKSFDI